MPSKVIDVPPPLGGVSTYRSFQDQEPQTTPDASNFWPYQTDTGRLRPATRPGFNSTGISGVTSGVLHSVACAWVDASTSYTGIAVALASGVGVLRANISSPAWDFVITGSSLGVAVAVYLNHAFLVRSSGSIKYVDLDAGSSSDLTTDSNAAGTGPPPEDCLLAATFGDRLYVGGATDTPHVLNACAIGDLLDWDTSKVHPAAAWSSGSAIGGVISHPLSALVPHSRDVLLTAGTDAIGVLIGNPSGGGQRDMMTSNVGIVGKNAWCHLPDGGTGILCRDGLYRIGPGSRSKPEALSRSKLPLELAHIDPTEVDISIDYDPQFQGVHIIIDRGSSNVYWFYDLVNGGFWPLTKSSAVYHVATANAMADDEVSGALFFGGSMYQLDADHGSGSAESIASYLVYGPIELSGAGKQGLLKTIIATLAEELDSDSFRMTWELYVGDSAQEAYANISGGYPAYTEEDFQVAGLNYIHHPRVRGSVAYIKIIGSTSDRICLERLELIVHEKAMRRVGGNV